MELVNIQRPRKFNDRINPLDFFDDIDFLARYRISKATFRDVLGQISPGLERNTVRSKAMSPVDQFSAALRYYASGTFQIVVGDVCGLSQSSVCRSVSAVSEQLDLLWDTHVYFPRDFVEIQELKQDFYTLSRFPHVIGCIDGTHIPILRPTEFEWQYVNRKFYHSLNVQGVCDRKGRFINMVVRHPGSAHDSHILRNSILWEYMENHPNIGYILGDSAYPCRTWLMTPLGNPITDPEKRYNYAHKRTRVLIENTFGRWKRRFPMLTFPNRRDLANVAIDIRATAILHNIAIGHNDPLPDNVFPEGYFADNIDPDIVENIENNRNRDANAGFATRQYLINNVFN